MSRLSYLPALALLAAACDEPPPPPPDAMEIEPSPRTVVVVQRGAEPIPGVRLIGHAYDGAVVSEAITDDAGVAALEVPAGGAITAAGDHPYTTVTGIRPGDVIVFDPAPLDDREAAPMHVTFAPHPEATHYELRSGCAPRAIDVDVDRPDAPTDLPFLARCASGTHDIMVVGLRGDDEIAFAPAFAQPYRAGGTIAIESAWQPMADGIITGVGPSGTTLGLADAVSNGGWLDTLGLIANGPEVPSSPFHYAPGIGDHVIWLLDDRRALTVRRPAAGEHVIAPDEWLPAVTDIVRDGRTVRWAVEPGDEADVVKVTLAGTWTLLAAPGASDVTFPQLPADLAGNDFAAQRAQVDVELVERDDLDPVMARVRPDTTWSEARPAYRIPGARARTSKATLAP